MKTQQQMMSPQDIVVLLKIIAYGDKTWNQLSLAEELFISQGEVSRSLSRSKYASLLDPEGKNVLRANLIDFLLYGISYVFPQKPGPVGRGVPTAHSAKPLNEIIESDEHYVWSSAKGKLRGQSITPLYPSVINAVQIDPKLYELLALVDALRVGRTREKNLAKEELERRILK